MTWLGKYLLLLPTLGVTGKAGFFYRMGSNESYVLLMVAGCVAAACILQTLATTTRRDVLLPLTIGALTLVVSLMLTVAAFPATLAQTWGNLGRIGTRWWFLPSLSVFLPLAVIIARSKINQTVPWALALWLFASYPFGLGHVPTDMRWPSTGFSGWQALAPQMFEADKPRGCIPVNPFPWYLGVDCQLLHSVTSSNKVGGWLTFQTELRLAPPPPAPDWSVDTIGIAFNKTPPLDAGPSEIPVTLVGFAADGHELGRSTAQFVPPTIFTYFYFPQPLDKIDHVKLIIAPGTSLAMAIEDQQTRKPFWVWFGRGRPEEGGEGIKLAEGG